MNAPFALGQRLAAMLPPRPRLLLAAAPHPGTLFELGLLLGRPQIWLIADHDGEHVDALMDHIEDAADRAGITATWPGRALLLHAPGGAWRIEGHVSAPDILMTTDLVDACVVEQPEVGDPVWRAYEAARRRPILLARHCPTGRVTWQPGHPADRRLHAAPPWRPEAIMRELRAAGCTVVSAASDTVVPRTALAELRSFIAQAVGLLPPPRRNRLAGWQDARMRQALAARLGLRISMRDILAWNEPNR